jgi:glycosyltransferase involved in cell wall biosynthesis
LIKEPCILIVGHLSGKILYGAELSFLDNLKSLVSLGHSISVIIPNEDNPNYVREILKYAERIYYLDIRWHLNGREYDQGVISKICEIAKDCNAQLIVSNTVTLREPLIAARRMGIPAVCSVREVPTDGSDLVKILQKEPQQIIDEIRREADYVIANSEFTLNRYHVDGKSALVRNTIDESLLLLEKESKAYLNIGYVAGISEEKGFLDFVEIARHFEGRDQFRFQVFGSGYAFLDAHKVNRLPANLAMKGYVNDKYEIYRGMDILLHLSRLEESFSRVISEAMAAATVVIAYKIGANSELIPDPSMGHLVPVGDLAQIDKLISLLSEDPIKAKQMAARARIFVRSNFSSSSQREDFRKVLSVLLPEAKRSAQSRDDFHISISEVNRSHVKDPFFVENRAGLGIATGLRFTSNSQIAVASLLGKQLHLYEFDSERKVQKVICTTDTTNGKSLVSIGQIDIDNEEQLLTANCEDGSLSIFELSPDAITFSRSLDVSPSAKNYVRGARFIPNGKGRIAACVTMGEKGIIFLDKSSGRRRGFFSKKGWGVKDMSMVDSNSRKFIAIINKNNVRQDQSIVQEIQILLVGGNRRLTRFKVLSEYQLPGVSIAGITTRNGYLLAAGESSDSIYVFSLHKDVIVMIDELLGFSSPRGVDISPDGTLLAVANYGTGSVTLRKIALPATSSSLATCYSPVGSASRSQRKGQGFDST